MRTLGFFLLLFATSFSDARSKGMVGALLRANSACYELDSTWAPQWAGIVGYWNLNGSGSIAAASTLSAVVGPSLTSENANGTGMAYASGRLNQGISFDGVDDRLYTSSTTLNTVNEGDHSMAAWVNPTNSTGGSVVTKNGFHLGIIYNYSTTNSFSYLLWDSANNYIGVNSAATFAPGKMYHVVGSVDRTHGTVKIYVNGVLSGTSTFTAGLALRTYGAYPVNIGSTNNNRYLLGLIDEVAIWNVPLSDVEVKKLYDQQSCGKN